MTPKQVLIKALNGEATRQELIDAFGIVNKDGAYVAKRKERVKVEFTPPTLDESIAFFNLKGYNKEGAKKFFDYYTAADWKDSKGKQVIFWKQKAIGNWFRDEFKIKAIQAMHKNIDIDNI